MSQSRLPEYYLSYVVNPSRHHSFVVVSKKSEENAPAEIIASFGLYGRDDYYLSHILSYGFLSEPGRIRSEHYYDERLRCTRDNSHLDPLIGKSFVISQETAQNVVIKGMKDTSIDLEKPPTEPKLKYTSNPALTAEENMYRKWFLNFPNRNIQGGPRFNGRDFNCHKYALSILRYAGIQDSYLESFNYPPGSRDLGVINLQNLNIEKKPFVVVTHSSYDNIFYAQENLINAAIALLKDYAESSFHFKRHYQKEVKAVLQDMASSPAKYPDIGAVIAAIEKKIPTHRYYGGSLQKRLDYLQHHKNDSEETFSSEVKARNDTLLTDTAKSLK